MVLNNSRLVSEAEYLGMPETVQRSELLDGKVIVPPAPTFGHQRRVVRLCMILEQWATLPSSPNATVGVAPTDIRFAPGRILQPDIFVFLATIPPDAEGPLDRIPDLCIEVLSTNRAYDRVTKRYLYAEAGVREYWLVDPASYVEVLTGDGLRSTRFVHDTLRTPLLPGFELEVSSLFT